MTDSNKNNLFFLRAAIALVDGVSMFSVYISWFLLIWFLPAFLAATYFFGRLDSETIIIACISWLGLAIVVFIIRWFARGFSERKKGRLVLSGLFNILLCGFYVWFSTELPTGVGVTLLSQGLVLAAFGVALLIVAFSKTARQL